MWDAAHELLEGRDEELLAALKLSLGPLAEESIPPELLPQQPASSPRATTPATLNETKEFFRRLQERVSSDQFNQYVSPHHPCLLCVRAKCRKSPIQTNESIV